MEMRTQRLLLRPLSTLDLDPMAEIMADPEVMRFIGGGSTRTRERAARSIEIGKTFWDRWGFGPFAVVEAASGRVVGDCLLIPIVRTGCDRLDANQRGPEIEIGYRLARSAWGRGIATEASAAVLDWGMKDPSGPGLRHLIGVTAPENAASRRVLEKIGLVHVGETDRYYGETLSLYETTPLPNRS